MTERTTGNGKAKPEDKNLIFVYGTLMRGERAHSFLSGAEYIGAYRLKGYAMYNLGRYPGIVPDPERTVYGEVYRVDRGMLCDMDRYEGEGSLYQRVTVTAENGTQTVPVFAYVYAREVRGRLIPEGKWNAREQD